MAARMKAGVDYPTDLSEFDRFFPDEPACLRYLERLRLPDGFICPKCGVAAEAWRMSRGLLLMWFIAAWEITGHKYGANAVATVNTDAWTGYRRLGQLGFAHLITNQSKSPHPAHVVMPGVHRVASLLKRWLLGTFQGAVSNDHLNYYLDEYTFRFNRRGST
jgi:hypothetical protein